MSPKLCEAIYKEPLKEFISEQSYELTYFSIDRVGNVETAATMKFTVDLTPPKTAVRINKPFYRDAVTKEGGLVLEAKDNLSGVQKIFYRFDNKKNFSDYTSEGCQADVKSLTQGKHLLQYYAVDQVGNQEEVHSFSFNLDTESPTVSYEISGPIFKKEKTIFVKPGGRLLAKAVDSVSGVHHLISTLDGAEPKNYAGPLEIPADGKAHGFTLGAVDHVAHSSKPLELNLQVDGATPKTTLTCDGTCYTLDKKLFLPSSAKVKLSAEDPESGVKNIFYRIDSGNFIPYTGAIKFPKANEYDLTYYAVDLVENQEVAHQFHVIIDEAKPQVGVEMNPEKKKGDRHVLPKGGIVRIAAIDQQAGVRQVFYQINGAEKKLYRGPIHMNEKGTFKLDIMATDWVGHGQTTTVIYDVE